MTDALTAFAVAHGLWGVGLAAFLAATLLPLSSEAAVVAAVTVLGLAPGEVLVAASLGNSLGAMSDYLLGRLLTAPALSRLERDGWGRRALGWIEARGHLALAGSCLPLVGDPLMIAAGVFRMRLAWVIGLGLGTRILRYVLVLAALR